MNNVHKSEMKDRIKAVRKHYNLTQEEFAKRLGTVQNTITGYETGRRNPSGSASSLICKEFGVNELWLRTGEGGPENMFTKIDPEDKYSISLGRLTVSENEFIHNAVNYLADAEPEKLKALEEFMKACLGIK